MSLRRIRPLLVVVVTVLAALGIATPASALTATGSVTGHVVDSAGAPVAGFAMKLAAGETQQTYHSYSATTDSSGAFTFTGVVPDYYALFDEEPGWSAAGGGWASVLVSAGATVTVPTATVLRAATVRGRIVSSVDGSPVPGQTVFAAGPSATTDADGAFSITVPPGAVTIRTGQRFWFGAVRAVSAAEGASVDVGTIALDPAGIVTTSFLARTGRAIGTPYQQAVVDGCRVTDSTESTCPGVAPSATVTGLQLAPGHHTIRYEVRSPLTSAVRSVTRAVDVSAGQETAVPQIVVPVVDPTRRATVEAGAYTRGHAVVIRVREGSYVDGGKPRLPVTIRVSGHVVRPTATRWRSRTSGPDVLVATLPERLSAHRALKVRVIVHGSAGYVGQTSAAVRLVRAR